MIPFCRVAALAVLLALTGGVSAQSTIQPYGDSQYQPQVAQPGKDVIWVPTPDDIVARMLVMARVGPKDFVMDLGAGDGKIAIMAAKRFGARAVGVEYNPDMAALANRNAERAGVADRAKIVNGDIFQTDFSKADVVTLFLLPSLNLKLRPTLLTMKPGTRVVSHAFDMEDWKPDDVSRLDGRTAYLWIVPANVQGRWHFMNGTPGFEQSVEVDFTQVYQRIEGEAIFGALRASLRDASLKGDAITFSVLDPAGQHHNFVGRVEGRTISGIVRGPKGLQRWRAERK